MITFSKNNNICIYKKKSVITRIKVYIPHLAKLASLYQRYLFLQETGECVTGHTQDAKNRSCGFS